jgi:hypothetical protein
MGYVVTEDPNDGSVELSTYRTPPIESADMVNETDAPLDEICVAFVLIKLGGLAGNSRNTTSTESDTKFV